MHILCRLQQNGLHSLTQLRWGLMISKLRLHELDNKICWCLMHLKPSNTRYQLCPVFRRPEQITINVNESLYKATHGNIETLIKSHKQFSITFVLCCCFCINFVNDAELLPCSESGNRRNLLVGQLLVQQTQIIDVITLILSWFMTHFVHSKTLYKNVSTF